MFRVRKGSASMHLVNVFLWVVLLLIALCGLELFIQHCQQEDRHRALLVRLMLSRKVVCDHDIRQEVFAISEDKNVNRYKTAAHAYRSADFVDFKKDDNASGNWTIEYTLPSRHANNDHICAENAAAAERVHCA
jgi:hypothetical protein